MGYFSDKVAVVTGGASGIGEAIASELSLSGSIVVIADINIGEAQRIAEALSRAGGRVFALRMDVTDKASVQFVLDSVIKSYGQLDIMINNAGIVVISEMEDTLEEDWDRLIDINLKGVVFGMQAAYKIMKQQGGGQILNTSSSSGLSPTPLFTAYSSVKHAVVGLSTATRIEAAPHHIKVNALCPGVVNTPVATGRNTSRGMDLEILSGGLPMMLSPKRVAKAALKGMKKNKAIIPVGMDSYLPYWANRFVPGVYDFVLAKGVPLVRSYMKNE